MLTRGIRWDLLLPLQGMTSCCTFCLPVRSTTGSRLRTGSMALLRPILFRMTALLRSLRGTVFVVSSMLVVTVRLREVFCPGTDVGDTPMAMWALGYPNLSVR